MAKDKDKALANHEVLDRANFITETFDDRILDHPSVQENPILLKKAKKISKALFKFYQKVGEQNTK